jgi:hypothetical protein
MREHQRRALLVIEQNLLAEAPELGELFDQLAEQRRLVRLRKALRLLAAILLLAGVVLLEVSLVLGALVLAGMSVIWWTERPAGRAEPDSRMQ